MSPRSVCLLGCALIAAPGLFAADDQVVFRSDVALARVDAQVVDRDNRAITGLRLEDFVLYEQGRQIQIRNFEREEMPVDVLLLLDVSASMRPHVQRIADAAHEAMRVLGPNDRVGIMVFDRSTRLRLPFRSNRNEVEREFENLLRQESFGGGTDIQRGLLDAARYVGREGRKEARRAIVILTDDMTERNRDELGAEQALARADAVLSALIAPDAMANRRRGGYGQPGGGYPGGGRSGGGIGGLGGIILGQPRGGGYPGGGQRYPGGGYPGGGAGPARTQHAGSSEIARASGGDSMSVDDAGAFEDTLQRIRQRYALHFYLPAGAKAGEQRTLELSLSAAALRRYPGAEVRYRRTYLAPSDAGAGTDAPVVVTQSGAPAPASSGDRDDEAPRLRRRRAVDPVSAEDRGPTIAPRAADTAADDSSTSPDRGTWRKSTSGDAPQAAPAPAPTTGGWRRATPEEQQQKQQQ